MTEKTSCQNCGVHIEFDVENANQFVPCPSCGEQTRLLLPNPPKIPPAPQSQFRTTPVTPAKHTGEPRVRVCLTCQKEISRKASFCPNCGEPQANESSAGIMLGLGAAILFIIGCGLVFIGCNGDIEESRRAESSAIRQTVYVIQYGSGFISLGLSMILAALVRIIRKP